MPITKLRGNTQIKTGTIESPTIRNYTILPEDMAPGTFTGEMFADGSIPLTKLDTSAGLTISPYVDMQAVVEPSAPSLGYGRLYLGLDKKLHFVNDEGEDYIFLTQLVGILDGGAPDTDFGGALLDGGEPGTVYTDPPVDGGTI